MVSDLEVKESPNANLITEHYPIIFKAKGTVKSPSRCVSRNPLFAYDYPKADWPGLCDYLLDIDFNACYESTGVEEIWSFIRVNIETGINLFIPKVHLRKR